MLEKILNVQLSNQQLAWRAAQDLFDGAYVNLGIGLPEMVARFQPEGCEVVFHTENGVLGFGESPAPGDEDWDIINAGKKAVTLKPGCSIFHHADSFAMIRGGHLDVAILGAYEISEAGDLANWSTGKGGVPAVGGAMDLVNGVKTIGIVTSHTTKQGKPKLVEKCSLPLTGVACVNRIYTSLAVIDVEGGKFVLKEKLPALTFDELQTCTGATLHIAGEVKELIVPEAP